MRECRDGRRALTATGGSRRAREREVMATKPGQQSEEQEEEDGDGVERRGD